MPKMTMVFYMKSGGREIRIYLKNDRTRVMKTATVSDTSHHNRCGGISRPLSSLSAARAS